MDDDNDTMQLDIPSALVGMGWHIQRQSSDCLDGVSEVQMRDADPVLYNGPAGVSPLLPSIQGATGHDSQIYNLPSLDCLDSGYLWNSIVPFINLEETTSDDIQSNSSFSTLKPFPRSQPTGASSHSTCSAPSNDELNVTTHKMEHTNLSLDNSVEGLGSAFENDAHCRTGRPIQQMPEFHSSSTFIAALNAGASSRLHEELNNEFLPPDSKTRSIGFTTVLNSDSVPSTLVNERMKLNRCNLTKHSASNGGQANALGEWLNAQLISGPYRNGQHNWPELVYNSVSQLRRQTSPNHNSVSQESVLKASGEYISVRGQIYPPSFLESVIEKEIQRQGGHYIPNTIGPSHADQTESSYSNRDLESAMPGAIVLKAHSPPKSTFSSAASDCSIGSHASWSSRKGRRLDLPQHEDHFQDTQQERPDFPLSFGDTRGKYYCQWCLTGFNRVWDLKRHEETKHAPQSEWICLADGEKIQTPLSTLCALCKQSWHIDHRITCPYKLESCMKKPESHRRFARKDKLQQHLIKTHGIGLSSLPSEFHSWERAIPASSQTLWDCYLCTKQKMTWSQRFEHIRTHSVIDWQDGKLCRCTIGHSRALQSLLSNLGLSKLWYSTCQAIWVCFDPSGCRTYDEAALKRKSDSPWESLVSLQSLKDIDFNLRSVQAIRGVDTYRCWSRNFPFGVNGIARTFWCGYCCKLVSDSERQYSTGSYDCAFLYHMDRSHINPLPSSPWQRISVHQLTELFLCVHDSVWERLSTSVRIDSAIKQALHWACEVLSYNLKIAGWVDSSLPLSEMVTNTISKIREELVIRAYQPAVANQTRSYYHKKVQEEFDHTFPVSSLNEAIQPNTNQHEPILHISEDDSESC